MKKPASRRILKSDLAKVDAHVIRPHEYKELPELTEEALSRAVADAISRVDRSSAFTIQFPGRQLKASVRQERLVAMLGGFFGGLALLLAGLGLYGVTSYAVSRRRA